MGMVLLVGMSLLVFVWVDLCGRMMKVDGRTGKHWGCRKKEVYFGWLFFSLVNSVGVSLWKGVSVLPFFLFASFLVS